MLLTPGMPPPAVSDITVTYHTDTVFLIAFDGELELIWEDPSRAAGVEWESAEAKSAAEQRAWPSGSKVLDPLMHDALSDNNFE